MQKLQACAEFLSCDSHCVSCIADFVSKDTV